MKDAIWIAAAIAAVAIAFWLCGLVWFAVLFVAFGLILGAIELYLWQTKRETLSSQFWRFSDRNKTLADALLMLLALVFLALLMHLRGCQ